MICGHKKPDMFRLGTTAMVLLAATLAGAPRASAVSVGYASSGLQLTLDRIRADDAAGLQITASGNLWDEGRQATPGSTSDGSHAIAPFGNPLALGIGDGLGLGSSAWTSTTGPKGLSDSFTYVDGLLSITNDSSTRARLRFTLGYDLTASATVARPEAELAYGRSFVGVESARSGMLFQAASEADSVFGPQKDNLLDIWTLRLTVAPGASETYYLYADLEASSASLVPVPVPPALGLMAVALGVLAALTFSRRPRPVPAAVRFDSGSASARPEGATRYVEGGKREPHLASKGTACRMPSYDGELRMCWKRFVQA